MRITRRTFLYWMSVAGGALGISGLTQGCSSGTEGVGGPDSAPALKGGGSPVSPLRMLILGGTGFIGPHQVHYALARGHKVTVFNRGKTAAATYSEMYADVEQLVGDRNGDIKALEGRKWDVVLDASGYEPAHVRATAELLKDSRRYLFVSTMGVYASRAILNQDESGVLGMPGLPEDQWKGYGPLKALCEKEAGKVLGDRLTVVRPGVVAGPGDGTDRFTYWALRMERGGDVLAPGDPDTPIELIDVRDASEFMIHLLERDQGGVYNVLGPPKPLTVAGMLEILRQVTGSDAKLTWVSTDFLQERKVQLPLWTATEYQRRSAARAVAAGLTYRPLQTTAADLLAWCREQPPERWKDMPGLSAEQEQQLLSAWRQRV